MQNIHFVDKNTNNDKNTMSIRYSSNGLSFCKQNNKHQLVELGHISDVNDNNIREIITSNDFFTDKYENINFAITKKEKMIIPFDLYNSTDIQNYYSLSHNISDDDIILCNRIKNSELCLVSTINADLYNTINSLLKNPLVINYTYSLIVHAMTHSRTYNNQIFLNINKDFIDIICIKYGNISLVNSFNYKSSDDILYHIINVIDRLKISRKKVFLTVSGNIKYFTSIEKHINEIIMGIEIAKDNKLENAINNKDFNSSNFIHLLNIIECV